MQPKWELSYSMRRFFVDEFFLRQVETWSQNAQVLDLGGHRQTKRGRFDIDAYGFRVVTANIATEKGTTVQADACYVPFGNNFFDVVVCAELLEHVFQPQVVLLEAYRVLRPGGTLLTTAPFLYRVHGDPFDYGRYTAHYWRTALSGIGFTEITIENQGLFYSVLLDFWKQYWNNKRFPRLTGRFGRWLVGSLLVFPWQRWALWRERQPRVRENAFLSSFTTGYGITAVK
ncbi:MAG: class I SAM-dependent methyltransferase [Ardenticatenaceae bacterium]|nr:class I SAM-dependent methyltransferase [Ardenticatenaceae bacterium]